MKNKLAIVIALLGWLACANSFAVPVSAAFNLSVHTIMESFFQQNPAFIIDRYTDASNVEHPLPAPVTVSPGGAATTPVLDLGNVGLNSGFTIRLHGRYFLKPSMDGLPALAMPFRIRLRLQLESRTAGLNLIQLVDARARNEARQPPPEALARHPEVVMERINRIPEAPVGGTLPVVVSYLRENVAARIAPELMFNTLL
jgi:hypothetical protein